MRLRRPPKYSLTLLLTLAFLPQMSRAAVTLTLNESSVDLPSVNAGTTTKVTDNSATLGATGSGTSAFSTSITYGTAPVAYKATQNWLAVSPSSGNITAGGSSVAITLTGNPSGLQAGPYSATVKFTAGSSSVTLTVTFTVQGVDLTAGLKAPLSSLAAGAKQQVGEIDITVTTANGTAAAQAVQVTTKTDGGNWLLTSADSPVTVTGPAAITITVDATNLAAGSLHNATVTVGCVNGAPCLPQPIQVSVQVTSPPPTLSSIGPNTCSVGASVAVTITGTGLTGATGISAGAGISVNGMTVVNATQITANFVVASNASTGARSVTVTTPGGTSNSVSFTVVSAIALSILYANPSDSSVNFSPPINADPVPDPDTTATLRATGSGTVNFNISNPTYQPFSNPHIQVSQKWLTSVSTSNCTAPIPPVSPSNCITAGQDQIISVQVKTAGLQPGTYKASVTFTAGNSSAKLTVTISINGADLTASLNQTVSALAANTTVAIGKIDVTIENTDGSAAQGTPVQFTTQTDVGTWLLTSPASQQLPASGPISLSVNASGLNSGTHSAKVNLTCTTCLPQQVQVTIQVTAPPPTLTSVTPPSGAAGSTVTVTLAGTNLTGATSVNVGGGITVNNLSVGSATQATASFVIPATATSGPQNVTITTPSGTSAAVTFTITPPPPPTLTSIAPTSGQQGATVPVILTGTNLAGVTAINAGPAISVTGINASSNTQATAYFNISQYASSGDQTVVVTTPGGLSNSVTFTITQASGPTLTSIVPNSGAPGATVPVTISGTNLTGVTGISAGAGISVTGLTAVSSTQMTANFAIAANAAGGNRSVTITTPAGVSNAVNFTVGGGSATASLPHFDVGNSFVTVFLVVNSGSTPASFSISFYDDNGKPSPLAISGFNTSPTLSDQLPANSIRYYVAGDPNGPGSHGSGVISADPSITVQAIFRRLTSNVYYEAAIPSSTGSNEVEIPFDQTTFPGNGSQIYTGFAIANLDGANTANVNCTARDAQGNIVPNALSVPSLQPFGHWSGFSFQALMGLRGSIDCTSNTKVSAVATRALGYDAISTLPVIKGGAATGSSQVTALLPHIDTGNSFVTGFYVVNSSSTPAKFSISFHGNDGSSILLPFGANLGSLTTLSDTIPGNGTKYYEAGDANNPNELGGSGLITADPSITIQAIFRRVTANLYYEAAVSASSGANEIEIPFDASTFQGNGSQIYTGFAVANMDASNTANVACTARDSQGNVIANAVAVPALLPNGHWASASFDRLKGLQGTIDCNSNTKIGAVAIRALGLDTISTLPVIVLR